MLIIWIFYFIIAFSSLMFYILYIDTLSFYLLITVAIMPIILLITLIITKKKIRLSLVCSNSSCYCGEVNPVILHITNTSLLTASCLRLKISYKNLLDGKTDHMLINTPAFSRNEQQICLKISTEYCGMIEVSLDKARIFDMLRMFSSRIKCPGEKVTFLVCPKMIPIEPQVSLYQNAESSDDTFSKRFAGDDPSEIFQLHEYRPGDRINRIHWKASVKQQDGLIVKDYSRPVSNSIAFILCNSTDGQDLLEQNNRIMKIAASFSVALAEAEAYHTFIWSAGENNVSAMVSDMESYIKFLSLRFSSKLDTSPRYKPLERYFNDLESGRAARFSHVIILTDRCDETLTDCLSNDNIGLKKTIICYDQKNEDMPQIPDDLTEVIPISGDEGIAALSDIII